ncbi:hypothetical protein [Dongia sp.]|uniref:hypothetical protein n=1 Tax=Dongia sp. TaxID=1977262 RepID=UPI003750130C
MIRWIDRIATICKVALLLFVLWIGLHFYAAFTEPTANRPYAETWMHAPVSELLGAQDDRRLVVERPDGAAGNIYRYRLGGWRGLKGKTYPGTFLGLLVDDRRMQSRVQFVTPSADAYCDIDFVANDAGVIEAITYSGNDCG